MPEEHSNLDDISTEEFRNLEDAPLSLDDEDLLSDDEPLKLTGESLAYQQTEDQINTFGGPSQQGVLDDDLDDELADEDVPPGQWREILATDLDDGSGVTSIHSPEMADMNVPGEIDIEDLDEDDLDGTDLPPDARLDPLEE